MTLYVVDASMFGPLLFDDEEDGLYVELPRLIAEGRCVVPEHWRLEVTNQLLNGLRRGRTTDVFADHVLTKLHDFPISVDRETRARAGHSFDLARRHGLSVYDAAYLELALRRRAALLTYDRELRAAAQASAVTAFPLS